MKIQAVPGGSVELALHGELDSDGAYLVREGIAEILTKGRPRRIEVNMRAVSFVDAAGISALVAAFQVAEAVGTRLVVTEPSRFVHHELWDAGVLGLFGAPEPYFGPVTRLNKPSPPG
ncbi:STAS domain-containing protein [Micromonospora sp. SL4-19]|uniref:STAS domain-containing protein n=1 Tax=Micromonospora sp. SL4-19 TaxID=3399129 RepID=UPI003A4DC4D1